LESFFSFSKDKAELLASRLEKINLVLRIDKVSPYRIRDLVLKLLFKLRGPIVFGHDIDGLFKGLNKNTNQQTGGFSSILRSEV
jgi:hypothetical protein